MAEILDQLSMLLAYGLGGAFILAMLERLVPVVPSYALFILLGSTLVSSPWELVPLIITVTIASTLSGAVWYGIGFVLGEERTHRAVVKYGKFVGLKEKFYLSLAKRYERNAFIATFIGQTVPVVRVYLSLPAGILSLPFIGFCVAVFLGSAIWAGGFTAMGYGIQFLGWNPLIATLIAVIVLLMVEFGIVWILQKRKRISNSA